MDSDDGVPATPENARVYAEFIARKAAEISGAHLDFSPGSLAEVDAIVEGFRKDGETAESIGATLFSFGCYVGEVFVRNSGGAWKNADDTPMKGVSGSPIVVELPTDRSATRSARSSNAYSAAKRIPSPTSIKRLPRTQASRSGEVVLGVPANSCIRLTASPGFCSGGFGF
jgi:hypothetical protein